MEKRDPQTLSTPTRETGGPADVESTSPSPDLERQGRRKAEEAKQEGLEKARELKAQGREAVEEVKEQAKERVDRGTSRAAERLDAVVRALGTAARQLEEEGEGSLASYTRQAASRVDRMTGYLREEDAPAMMADLEDMARTNPGTFIGTTFAAGLALGRFLRASSPEGHPGNGSGADGPQEPAGERGGRNHG